MRVKRFVANTMQEAIALVKADFGPEAVILHTKKRRRPGLLGLFGKSQVEVIAATDARTERNAPSPKPLARVKDVASRPIRAGGGTVHESAAASEIAKVREELSELKRVLQPASDPIVTADSAALERVRAHLQKQDVHEKLIGQVLDAISAQGKDDQLHDEAWIRQRVRYQLIEGMLCADPWQVGEESKVQCLIGPTGVGKTTTIAKLAANYSLLAKKRVALITVDTYRIAAVEQLKTYAEIIDVPVDVAYTPQELKAALARRQEADLILIDTAGRSHKNTMQMAELRAFVEMLDSAQIHLVLSATTRLYDMLDLIERFQVLPISYTIVTKIDETSSYGMLYNLCRLSGIPLSYVTNGQNVPDDIEVAQAERIADLILGVDAYEGPGRGVAPNGP